MIRLPNSILALLLLATLRATAGESVYDIELVDIDGNKTSLEEHRGKVMLIVNVASKCGYTGQYRGLESLYQARKSQGFVVLGFPCNQFGGQEPGTNQEIQEFCKEHYNLSFPMYSKIKVNGENRHPLYQYLVGSESPYPGNIGWNFNKFLLGREGEILNRYPSVVGPHSKKLNNDIEEALGK